MSKSLPIVYGSQVCTGRLVCIERTPAPTMTIGVHDFEMDLSRLSSPTLARLIDEVRNEDPENPAAYSRFHNRHNRSGYQRF